MPKATSRKVELIDEVLNEHDLEPQAILGNVGILEQMTRRR